MTGLTSRQRGIPVVSLDDRPSGNPVRRELRPEIHGDVDRTGRVVGHDEGCGPRGSDPTPDDR
jgi:hypothetical protein